MRYWKGTEEDRKIVNHESAGQVRLLPRVETVQAIGETRHLGGAVHTLLGPQAPNAMAGNMSKGLQTVTLLLDFRIEHTSTTGMADAIVLETDGRQTKHGKHQNGRAQILEQGHVLNATD